jgi:DNA polymerase III sliding clamp (beta) subunit (PCNA family)
MFTAAASDTSLPVFANINVVVKPGSIELQATNRYNLHRVELPAASGDTFTALIPAKELLAAVKATKASAWDLKVDPIAGTWQLYVDHVITQGRTGHDKFPNVNQVWPLPELVEIGEIRFAAEKLGITINAYAKAYGKNVTTAFKFHGNVRAVEILPLDSEIDKDIKVQAIVMPCRIS